MVANQKGGEDRCIFKVLSKEGKLLNLVARLNNTEKKTKVFLNSSTVKAQSCACFIALQWFHISIYLLNFITGLKKLKESQPSEVFMPTLTRCFLRIRDLIQLQFESCPQFWKGFNTQKKKTKRGIDELTPPVNSDFSQCMITCSVNSCDWWSHTDVAVIRGCDRWWVYVGCRHTSIKLNYLWY